MTTCQVLDRFHLVFLQNISLDGFLSINLEMSLSAEGISGTVMDFQSLCDGRHTAQTDKLTVATGIGLAISAP
jgi:hypothetical protein